MAIFDIISNGSSSGQETASSVVKNTVDIVKNQSKTVGVFDVMLDIDIEVVVEGGQESASIVVGIEERSSKELVLVKSQLKSSTIEKVL